MFGLPGKQDENVTPPTTTTSGRTRAAGTFIHSSGRRRLPLEPPGLKQVLMLLQHAVALEAAAVAHRLQDLRQTDLTGQNNNVILLLLLQVTQHH